MDSIDDILEQETNFYQDPEVDLPAGSSLKGTITADYNDLVDVFGEPGKGGALTQDKRAWWTIIWDDGVTAQIYDYNKAPQPISLVTSWNVASKNAVVVDRIDELLR